MTRRSGQLGRGAAAMDADIGTPGRDAQANGLVSMIGEGRCTGEGACTGRMHRAVMAHPGGAAARGRVCCRIEAEPGRA